MVQYSHYAFVVIKWKSAPKQLSYHSHKKRWQCFKRPFHKMFELIHLKRLSECCIFPLEKHISKPSVNVIANMFGVFMLLRICCNQFNSETIFIIDKSSQHIFLCGVIRASL